MQSLMTFKRLRIGELSAFCLIIIVNFNFLPFFFPHFFPCIFSSFQHFFAWTWSFDHVSHTVKAKASRSKATAECFKLSIPSRLRKDLRNLDLSWA